MVSLQQITHTHTHTYIYIIYIGFRLFTKTKKERVLNNVKLQYKLLPNYQYSVITNSFASTGPLSDDCTLYIYIYIHIQLNKRSESFGHCVNRKRFLLSNTINSFSTDEVPTVTVDRNSES